MITDDQWDAKFAAEVVRVRHHRALKELKSRPETTERDFAKLEAVRDAALRAIAEM